MKKSAPIFTLLLLLSACSTVSPRQSSDAAQQEILALEQRWGEAIRTNDMGRLEPLLADDFRLVIPNGAVQDKAAWLKAQATANVTSYSAAEVRVIADGDVAVVTNLATLQWKSVEGAHRRRTTRV